MRRKAGFGIDDDAITAAHDGDIQMIDGTSVRAHQQAATAWWIEIIVSVAPEAGAHDQNPRGHAMRKASNPTELTAGQSHDG
jgi:hypothetical protein